MNTVTSSFVILSSLLCIAYAYPANIPIERDLNTAETIWDIFNQGGRGYSGWGTGVQSNPVVANPYTSYPTSYAAYPTYATYGVGNNYYGKYPSVGSVGSVGSVYPGYASGFPTYENYAVHGGHGFGKYGKY
ncbi:uncharacterized protein LOC135843462 [Planococcus citri]|uniref:uncharacterized protein LOC135843462 n=1 Tax=Planococcus citri TaxID=170843 RepID=UPI0031F933DD